MNRKDLIGLGVAGNFAQHLEQAGEANDFKSVVTGEKQPKAIFPFYVPSEKSGFLSVYPLTHSITQIPPTGGNLQMEPEVGILFDIIYENNLVVGLKPQSFGAYNDCSIRRPNAKKISEKKNWGAGSKGIAEHMLKLDSLAPGCSLDDFRIASFLKRGEACHAYGVDSPVIGYNYFHEELLAWIIERMNHQPDMGPMEKISMHLANANYPSQALVSIGATSYTDFGESHYLEEGDITVVCVYDGTLYSEAQIYDMGCKGIFPTEGMSVLMQKVTQ